jgi:hypothetical protein
MYEDNFELAYTGDIEEYMTTEQHEELLYEDFISEYDEEDEESIYDWY